MSALFFHHILSDPLLHAKWINTLSYLENCGARKIARCEHPTQVKEEMLKHAAEEFRHAHFLKKQIAKVTSLPFPTYSLDTVLGGMKSLRYLDALDLQVSRALKELAYPNPIAAAYLLVTFAIEKRALMLYPLYHASLTANRSSVRIKSILLEEEDHLAAMEKQISEIPQGRKLARIACDHEQNLFVAWIDAIEREIQQINIKVDN